MRISQRPSHVTLVEGRLTSLDGHRARALIHLVEGCAATDIKPTVVCLGGLHQEVRATVERLGGRVVVRPRTSHLTAWSFVALGYALRAVGRRLPGPARRHGVDDQLNHVAKAFLEIAALRVARDSAPASVVVMLTAGQALHAVVGAWGGDHLRILHEQSAVEGRTLARAHARMVGRGGSRVTGVCTTRGVEDEYRSAYPWMRTARQTFATYLPSDYLSDFERRSARAELDLPASAVVACLVGGWWWWKDVGTVVQALSDTTTEITLLVVGHPLDNELLARLKSLPHVSVPLVLSGATEEMVRTVYAASDLTVISRRAGVDKESGLVIDALRHGVPMVVSDNDPALTKVLGGADWARMFTAGDAASLTGVLDGLVRPFPARPPAGAPELLGSMTPRDAVLGYLAIALSGSS